MAIRVVNVPSTKRIIQLSPGFEKKDLSMYKVDLLALCGYGCKYCFSNQNYYLRMNWEKGDNFKKLAEQQLGRSVSKKELPNLSFEWPDVLEKLEKELRNKSYKFGEGKVLVFSQLTDGFSPRLVNNGTTRKALDLLIDKTSFRIRVLTKNAVVGEPGWIDYFLQYKDRFTVGLSIGSLENDWSKRMELRTSSPAERLVALHNLQEAGVSTYGMLCPVFPDLLVDDGLTMLIEKINPSKVEYIWAEPYNDRNNWELVRDSYTKESESYRWFNHVFKNGKKSAWSKYATGLYEQLSTHAKQNGWSDKLKYLLFEDGMTEEDVTYVADKPGILFQSIDSKTKRSKNPVIAATQMGAKKKDVLALQKIERKIFEAIEDTHKAWLQVGTHIIALLTKMNSIVSDGKHKDYWQLYFGVNSFDEYCSEKLNLSREAVYQMIFAVKWIQATRPNLLKGKGKEIPYYTNFRVLKPHFDEITSDPDKFAELIDKSYTGSRTELIKKRDELFRSKDIEADVEEVFDMRGKLKEFKATIEDHLSDELRVEFQAKMEELEKLLLD